MRLNCTAVLRKIPAGDEAAGGDADSLRYLRLRCLRLRVLALALLRRGRGAFARMYR